MLAFWQHSHLAASYSYRIYMANSINLPHIFLLNIFIFINNTLIFTLLLSSKLRIHSSKVNKTLQHTSQVINAFLLRTLSTSRPREYFSRVSITWSQMIILYFIQNCVLQIIDYFHVGLYISFLKDFLLSW